MTTEEAFTHLKSLSKDKAEEALTTILQSALETLNRIAYALEAANDMKRYQ